MKEDKGSELPAPIVGHKRTVLSAEARPVVLATLDAPAGTTDDLRRAAELLRAVVAYDG